MKIGDELFFSPRVRFRDLALENRESTISSLADRIAGFYLDPSLLLSDAGSHFASGLLVCAAVDFIGRYAVGGAVGARFSTWLATNVPAFAAVDPDDATRSLAKRFYDEFRNGLVHEGRIKHLGQFAQIGAIASVTNHVLMVDSRRLAASVRAAVDSWLASIRGDEAAWRDLRDRLISDFADDVASVQTV